MTPKVTVLVAVHNGGAYLHEAIESILAQSFADFELLVVDDASTDDTPAYLASLSDPRVRVLRNDANLGQVPSLNRGLNESVGRYVARLDADDVMLPARLARQVAVLDDEPGVALVGTWIDVVDENGETWARVRGTMRDVVDLLAAILVGRYPFGHPSLMFRRDVVLELGGYDPTLAPAEDKDLYRRLALAGYGLRVVEEPLVRYRRHDEQLSQVQASRQLRVDDEGQQRFLAQVVGPDSARPLRLLLVEGVGDPGLLDLFLDRAGPRFSLTADERRRLTERVARHVAGRALLAGRPGEPVLEWSARAYRPAALYRVLLPVVPPARAAGRTVRTMSRHPLVGGLRRRARRSRLLRGIYSRLG